MRAAVMLLLIASTARAELVERSTLKWVELERMLSREGASLRALKEAPRAWSIPHATVEGEVEDGRAQLRFTVDVEVLADRWVLVPLLGRELAVSSANVSAPDGQRGLLARDPNGVVFVGDGAGRYRLELTVEGPLERGTRLRWAPAGLAGGRARLVVRGVDRVAGKSGWRTQPVTEGEGLTVEAALGAAGLELQLASGPEPAPPASAGLEELEAVTVVSLGGSGVTRLAFTSAPDDDLVIRLPEGARAWKLFVSGAAQPLSTVTRADGLHLALKKTARVEIAYTFAAPPLGIRGRYHVELPRLPHPVRDARWEVWLPDGLVYAAPQAALAPGVCGGLRARTRTPLSLVGKCLGFQRAVLEPGRAFVEGSYDQPL